jgi:site-specific DNA recombinase
MRYFHYCRKSTDDDDHQVASLESQRSENERRFLGSPEIEIVGTVTEARSARTPGRPVFNDLLDRIERGEADGLLAWHPDRLARNSVDGGRIIYLLDTGKLKDLKFSTYTFENTPQGKFMLQIVFANSKYYVDSLSENVRRGIRTKILNGWSPNRPPLGYLNGDGTTPIIPDPERFPLIVRMWELALTGTYSVPQIRAIATDAWGLRTRKTKRGGGTPLSRAATYNLFANVFYAGVLRLDGRVHSGKHKPMITLEQFATVQRLIGRPGAPQPKTRSWAYTGMIRCGSCGLAVTAEEKVKRSGRSYLYYHCTKRRGRDVCREPYAPVGIIEREIERYLEGITISDTLHDFALARIDRETTAARAAAEAAIAALERAAVQNEQALRNLRRLRISDLISEQEFAEDRVVLETERIQLAQRLASRNPTNSFEPARMFVTLSNRALKWFREGDDEVRRLILETVGSNSLLAAKKLRIDGRYPFRRYPKPIDFPQLWAVVDDIRTHEGADSLIRLVASVRRLIALTIDYDAANVHDASYITETGAIRDVA